MKSRTLRRSYTILYASDESGRYEVYARDFAPDRVPAYGDKKLQVSVNGGDKPRWSADGNEIYFLEKGRKLMAVEVSRGTSLRVGIPQELFEVETRGFIPYDVIGHNEFIVNVAPTEESGPRGVRRGSIGAPALRQALRTRG